MYLKKYQPSDFALLAQWVSSPALLFQFSGTDFTFPLTQTQLDAYCTAHSECVFYIAYSAQHYPFAFGEIVPQDTNIPRLGRLLVGDSRQRGQGLGTCFVQLLVAECVKRFGCTYIDLYVLRNNEPARRCYEKVGFRPVPHASFQLEINTGAFTIDKMRLVISDLKISDLKISGF